MKNAHLEALHLSLASSSNLSTFERLDELLRRLRVDEYIVEVDEYFRADESSEYPLH